MADIPISVEVGGVTASGSAPAIGGSFVAVGIASTVALGTPSRVQITAATGFTGATNFGTPTAALSYGRVTGIAPTLQMGEHLSYVVGATVYEHHAVRIKLAPQFGTGKAVGYFDVEGVPSAESRIGVPVGQVRGGGSGIAPASGIGTLTVRVRCPAAGVYAPVRLGTPFLSKGYLASGIRGRTRMGVHVRGGISVFPQSYIVGWIR